MADSRLDKLARAAEVYGERSFDNYAQVRSVAEQIRDSMCDHMSEDMECVYLVPPQGAFMAQNYRSMAFSVAGKGFLPLEPISFGLAFNISGEGDYMRLVLTCRKEGDKMYIMMEDALTFEVDLPMSKKDVSHINETLYQHLLSWFNDRVTQYDDGDYGAGDIGFDIQRIED